MWSLLQCTMAGNLPRSFLGFIFIGYGVGRVGPSSKTLPFTRLGSFKLKTIYYHNWRLLHIPTTRDTKLSSWSPFLFSLLRKSMFEMLLLNTSSWIVRVELYFCCNSSKDGKKTLWLDDVPTRDKCYIPIYCPYLQTKQHTEKITAHDTRVEGGRV